MRSSEKDLEELYLKVAQQLKISKFLVKDIVQDIFSFSREFVSNPTSPALLLHDLGTIEAQYMPIKYMLKKKTISEEERKHWEDYLEKVIEYHETKKIKNKKNERSKTLPTTESDNWSTETNTGSTETSD